MVLPLALGTALVAQGQLSLVSAVDLALKSSPRVHLAEADVNKAAAALAQAKDVYIPAISVGSGLGYSYGYPLGQPSVVNTTMQSMLLSFGQRDYIRAARASLQAATLTLNDTRAAVEQDTALAYLALDHDLAREQALHQELDQANQLVNIVSERLNAGVDTAMDLTQAKLTAAQTRLALLDAQDATATDQLKLAHLVGLPATGLTTLAGGMPPLAAPQSTPAVALPQSPAVLAAFANAHAKQEIAWGDARRLHRPEIMLAGQYSLFAKFNNYELYFPRNPITNKSVFQYNNAGIGIQMNWPIFDRSRRDHARESAADAVHAYADAEMARDKESEGNGQLARSTAELSARADVADLQQQLAQQQLEVIHTQLQANASSSSSAPPKTPKDQASAAIDERSKFIDLLNARFDLQQAQIQLLRVQGRLDAWLRAAAATP